MDNDKLDSLADRINGLSPPDRLRLAAELLEKNRPMLAKSIIEKVAIELGAVGALDLLGLGTTRKVTP